jgi:hypothetical protein
MNLDDVEVLKMNRIGRRCAECFSIAALACAVVLSTEIPLLAESPQSSQSGSTTQTPNNSLPDAPQSQTPTPQPPPATAPSGAAGAKAANAKGAPVAQPAGAAVAPARQRGHRSLLIKLGLLAGAGVAVGSAVALSQGSPSRPPGASASASHP